MKTENTQNGELKGRVSNREGVIKGLKISKEAKTLLKVSKQHGETYSQTIERLIEQNSRIPRGETLGQKGEIIGKKDNSGFLKEEIPDLLASFGLSRDDVGLMIKTYFENLLLESKNEGKRLRLPYGKPFDVTKAVVASIWIIGLSVVGVLCLPDILDLLRMVI